MNRIPLLFPLVFPLALALFFAPACHAPDPAWSHTPEGQRGEPTVAGAPLAVPRASTSPLLDGKLDDPMWSHAAVLAPLVDPGGGEELAKSPVSAWARLTWDAKNLYLGVLVRDRSPSSPFSRDAIDPHVWARASGIELILQPGDPGDNRDYYELQVDVNGAIFDSHFDDYNAPRSGTGSARTFGHQDWSSHLQRKIFVERGRFYSVELALPWLALAPARVAIPPHVGDVWRLNLYTFRDGQRHALAWSPIRGQGNFHKASRFGRVRFE